MLAIVLAVSCAHMGLAMADCRARFAGKARRWWRMATAAVLGTGIWAVHFVGISSSASILPPRYSLAASAGAFFVAVAGAFGALALARSYGRNLAARVAAGVVFALTLIAVPLIATRGPGWTASISYHLPSQFGSALLAIAGSWAAFRLDLGISTEKGPLAFAKASGAVLLGLTIAATHYAVTSAMTFIEIYPAPAGGYSVSASFLSALGVAGAVMAVLGGAAAVALADKRVLAEAARVHAKAAVPKEEPIPVKQEPPLAVAPQAGLEPVVAEPVEFPDLETPAALTPNILSLSAAVALSAKTVLVADALESQSALQALLASWQMNPVFAHSAAEALDRISSAQRTTRPIDLILVDSRLAGGGFTLVEKLQAMQPAPPVVMLLDSADGSQQLEKRGKLRVAAHVVKPVWRADLERALVTALFRCDLDHRPAASETTQTPEGVSLRLPE